MLHAAFAIERYRVQTGVQALARRQCSKPPTKSSTSIASLRSRDDPGPYAWCVQSAPWPRVHASLERWCKETPVTAPLNDRLEAARISAQAIIVAFLGQQRADGLADALVEALGERLGQSVRAQAQVPKSSTGGRDAGAPRLCVPLLRPADNRASPRVQRADAICHV
eukprot:Amastigsp_a339239_73.p2 type:complete len:167 gc:universal Amastigsp_a339239_73:593-1093(+)